MYVIYKIVFLSVRFLILQVIENLNNEENSMAHVAKKSRGRTKTLFLIRYHLQVLWITT